MRKLETRERDAQRILRMVAESHGYIFDHAETVFAQNRQGHALSATFRSQEGCSHIDDFVRAFRGIMFPFEQVNLYVDVHDPDSPLFLSMVLAVQSRGDVSAPDLSGVLKEGRSSLEEVFDELAKG